MLDRLIKTHERRILFVRIVFSTVVIIMLIPMMFWIYETYESKLEIEETLFVCKAVESGSWDRVYEICRTPFIKEALHGRTPSDVGMERLLREVALMTNNSSV